MIKDDGIRFEPYDDRFGLLLNCAVKYAVRSVTYAPALLIEMITPILPKLNDRTLHTFCEDIQGAGQRGDELLDAPAWSVFLSDVQKERERRKRELHAVDAYE